MTINRNIHCTFTFYLLDSPSLSLREFAKHSCTSIKGGIPFAPSMNRNQDTCIDWADSWSDLIVLLIEKRGLVVGA
jgi:hypothetical protein